MFEPTLRSLRFGGRQVAIASPGQRSMDDRCGRHPSRGVPLRTVLAVRRRPGDGAVGTCSPKLPAWSPDGKWLTFFNSNSGLMKVAVGGSEAPVSIGFSQGCENPAQWSPDGAWIACAAAGVELITPDGKTRRTVGNRRAFVTWSRDGKEI